MATLTPAEWKRFYAAERARLGRAALDVLIERASSSGLDLPRDARAGHAVVFPHTRLEVTGHMVAAVAGGVIESGATEVLAIGVLHGSPSKERRVHLDGEASTASEFSLDAFRELVGSRVRVHARFPLLVGEEPASLPGIDELARMAERMPLVATTDPVHFGVGYGDTPDATFDAAASLDRQLRALESHDFAAFLMECKRARSDFRDVGPVLAMLLGAPGSWRFDVRALDLVDYTEALAAPPPTWVAGALIEAARKPAR